VCAREREREKSRERRGERGERKRESVSAWGRQCTCTYDDERAFLSSGKELSCLVVTAGDRRQYLKHFYAYTAVFEASLHIRH